jgi:hypothetical protein
MLKSPHLPIFTVDGDALGILFAETLSPKSLNLTSSARAGSATIAIAKRLATQISLIGKFLEFSNDARDKPLVVGPACM